MVKASSDPKIVVVGPCGAGKSTLVAGLRSRGVRARQIAQEHSFVPAMWRLIARPDVLIYLHASFQTCSQRKRLDWSERDHREQLRRLAHARRNSHILLETDDLTPAQVLEKTLQALGVGHT